MQTIHAAPDVKTALAAKQSVFGKIWKSDEIVPTAKELGYPIWPWDVAEKPRSVSAARGPTDKVKPRLEACRAQIMAMVDRGLTVSATDLLDVAEKRYVYTDIGVVVEELLTEGIITQSNKGRKLFWSKVP